MTQLEVAKAASISVSAYRKYEYGLRSPSDGHARAIERVLELKKGSWGEK